MSRRQITVSRYAMHVPPEARSIYVWRELQASPAPMDDGHAASDARGSLLPKPEIWEVARIRRETATSVSIAFRVAPSVIAYRPGQFLTIAVPLGNRLLPRCYSLSSSPHCDEALSVTVQRVPGGLASNWLVDHCAPGMHLEVLPPQGVFTPTSLEADMTLICAGSGITPIYAIAKSALSAGTGRLLLLHCARDADGAIFRSDLDRLAENSGGRVDVRRWFSAEKGRISEDDMASLVANRDIEEAFLCGPRDFMDRATAALVRVGVARDAIRKELFQSLKHDPFSAPEGHDADATVIAAEGEAFALEVELDGAVHSLAWAPQRRLLDLLLDAGIDAPHFCREGSCGTCLCRIEAGAVELADSETMSVDDLEAGYALACQALPVRGPLKIAF